MHGVRGRVKKGAGGGWEEEAGVSEMDFIYGEQRGVCVSCQG